MDFKTKTITLVVMFAFVSIVLYSVLELILPFQYYIQYTSSLSNHTYTVLSSVYSNDVELSNDIDIMEGIQLSNNFSNLSLATKLFNSKSNEWIYCDPKQHKYIQLILSELDKSIQKSKRNSINSIEIDKWLHNKSNIETNNDYGHKILRLKYAKHRLYVNSLYPPQNNQRYYDQFYHFFASFFEKYSKYISEEIESNFNIDFMIYFWDSGTRTFDWKTMPIFTSEGNANTQYSKYGSLLLLSISRSLCKLYRIAVPQKVKNSKYSMPRLDEHEKTIKTVFVDGLPKYPKDAKPKYILFDEWNNKTFSFLFRGGNWNAMRTKLINAINLNYSIYKALNNNNSLLYYDIKWTKPTNARNEDITYGPFISTLEQSKTKFNVVIDGLGVRDMWSY